MGDVQLASLIFCAKDALRFNGEPLSASMRLPGVVSAGRELGPGELGTELISSYLSVADIPLAFHRASPQGTAETSTDPFSTPATLSPHQEQLLKLESYGRILQYRFSDGLVLCANEIFYHPYGKLVSKSLLPLKSNSNSQTRARLTPGRLTAWQTEAEQVILGILTFAARSARLAARSEEIEALTIEFCLDDKITIDRPALILRSIELDVDSWGPWRISTELPQPVSGVHHGRARLELDPAGLGGDMHGLAQTFFVDAEAGILRFHGFEDQLLRLKSFLSAPPEEHGLALHLTGHAQIQAAITELREVSKTSAPKQEVNVHPGSYLIPEPARRPRLMISGDGSFRLFTHFKHEGSEWEAHGFPQSMSYLLLNLQHGLGATTGIANTHLAHTRKGVRRERDMKFLRNIGYAMLVFYDAANYAFGLPLSDGTVATSVPQLLESLYARLGSLLLKSEGWPTQSGSIAELCSKNVTTLIEGFIGQVIADIEGRDISVFLPQGEWRIEKLSREFVRLYHSLVGDLATATAGTCFVKARAKYFENFTHGRGLIEREDLVVRPSVSSEVSARMIYQPGIDERYVLPEPVSIPIQKREQILSLINLGFALAIDGKEVEEFEANDFRPEFDLRESAPTLLDGAIPTAGHRIDWFELNPKFFFRGNEITIEQAARLSRDGLIEFEGKLYRVKTQDMPKLSRLNRFWSTIQAAQTDAGKLGKRRKTEETYFQLPRSQTLELLALRASGVKVSGGPRWQEITRFYDSLDQARSPHPLPPSFKTELQPYQSAAALWIRDLYELGLGGILADDMGLGKTVTSLAFLEGLRTENKMGATLILVPTSLTYNWLAEASRFAPEMPVSIFSSREPERMRDFLQDHENAAVICTYGLLQEHSEFFAQTRWNCLILDEAQNLKNITTKRTTAARKLEAGFKLCLTGTPLENHYGELYSLFDLLVPGSLGDLHSFRERFVNPTRVLRDDIDFLKLKIRPLLMRRTKAQVLHQLPPKIETTVKLPFEDEQRRIYRDIASAYNEQVRAAISRQGEAKTQLQMLTALLRLRQVCSDPSSVPGVKYAGEPPKITTLIEALGELIDSGASALVFTQFLSTFERIRAQLTAAKIRHFDICGSDSRVSREKKIQGFQDCEQGAVMLMTLKTGGVGLNLVKASYIFHIEPWWNPAVENQATDRAHRIGQTKAVQVYRYLIKDSVEEKIEILKDIKAKRFDALFAASESESELGVGSSGSLSQQDFEFLLG